MPKLQQPIRPGSFISSVVTIIESYADVDKEPLATRMAIMDAVCAEIIWGLGAQYDTDIVISRHADNVAAAVQQMNDFEADKEEAPPEPPEETDTP